LQLIAPRLKDIWGDIMSLTDQSNNFNRLRRTMCDAAPPCIPYLNIFLDDIASIEKTLGPNSTDAKKIPLRKALALGRIVSILHTMKELNAEANFDWEWNDNVAGCFLNYFVHIHDSHKLPRRQSSANLIPNATESRPRRPSRTGSDMSKRHSVAYLAFKRPSDAESPLADAPMLEKEKPERVPSTKSIPSASTPPAATTGSTSTQDAQASDSIKIARISKKKTLFKSMENVFSIFRRSPANK
jgi:hypothetical protein